MHPRWTWFLWGVEGLNVVPSEDGRYLLEPIHQYGSSRSPGLYDLKETGIPLNAFITIIAHSPIVETFHYCTKFRDMILRTWQRSLLSYHYHGPLYSTAWSDQRKHHRSVLQFRCDGNPPTLVVSHHKWPVALKAVNMWLFIHYVDGAMACCNIAVSPLLTHWKYWSLALNHRDKSFAFSWWRHQMETFSALLAICAGNSPVTGEFHAQRPVTRSFDVFFDLRPDEWLSKQTLVIWDAISLITTSL